MMFKAFLIKYGEIGIKGKNRYLFEDALMNQIRFSLKNVDGTFEVTKEQGRIYVEAKSEFEYDEVLEALKRVFGIVEICPMVQVESTDFEGISAAVLDYIDKTYKDKNFTFKVDARRADKKFPMSSMPFAAQLGHDLLQVYENISVDVH